MFRPIDRQRAVASQQSGSTLSPDPFTACGKEIDYRFPIPQFRRITKRSVISGAFLIMNIDQLRDICMSFPGVTEQIQWKDDLVFKVAGKMFAVTPLVPGYNWLSLKASPESFVELTERPGIIPAPYLARASWIAIESPKLLSAAEVAALLRTSYDLVVKRLPRRTRENLALSKPTARETTGRSKTDKKRCASKGNARRKPFG
jgi:predicted DNA-binding protein (MmcQ/YjbR family)